MTVVRRPLQSMVCSGRLTICDLKFVSGALNIVYGPTPIPRDAHGHIDVVSAAYLIDASAAAGAIKHTLTSGSRQYLPSQVPRRKFHHQNSEFAMGHGLGSMPSAILDAGAPQYEVSIAAISAQTPDPASKVAP